MLSDKKHKSIGMLVVNGDTWANIVANNAKPSSTKLTEVNIDDNGWTKSEEKNTETTFNPLSVTGVPI